MSNNPHNPEPPVIDTPQARRARLIGRLVVIGFGLLLLAYIIPIFIPPR